MDRSPLPTLLQSPAIRRGLGRVAGAAAVGLAALTLATASGALRFEPTFEYLEPEPQVEQGLPRPADPELAAPLAEAILRAQDALDSGSASFAPDAWEPDEGNALASSIDAVAPVLDALARAVESEPASALLARADEGGPRRYVQLHGEPAHLAELRPLANALCSRAIVAARRGELDGAIRSLRHTLELARLVDDGTSLGLAAGLALHAIAFDAAEQVAREHRGAAARLLAELGTELEKLEGRGPSIDAFDLELLYLVQQSRRMSGTVACGVGIEPPAPSEDVRDERFLDELLEQYAELKRTLPDGLHESWYAAEREARRSRSSSPLGLAWSGVARASAHQRRSARLFRVALALVAHRDRTGAWPRELDELAPAFGGTVPVDLTTKAPLRYELTEERVWLAPEDVGPKALEHGRSTWTRCAFSRPPGDERDG